MEAFKNLRDFEVAFESSCLTTVLLGRNGTGKSNLLEALVIVLRDLDLGEPPSFSYRLDYECRKREIRIDAKPGRKGGPYDIRVDGEPVSLSAFRDAEGRRFMPSNVFGYYSGPSRRFETHFAKHQEKFYQQLLKGDAGEALRPFFFARLIHSQFVLLAFFYQENNQTAEFLRDYLGVQELESVLFVLKEPPRPFRGGDPRFWNARGAVQAFLSELFERAMAPLRLDQRVEVEFAQKKDQEHLYLFLKDRAALAGLRAKYDTGGEFFKALESTYLSKVLAEVRIRVQVRDCEGALTFRELSEGEQQLLTVLGLLRFTREEEALFLLDEPDTHLNPNWSLRYHALLEQFMGEEKTSQIIMTTHDPLTVAGLTRDEVRILTRDSESPRITADPPDRDPKGMGVAGILTSDLFGLRSQLDLATLELLDEKRDLASRNILGKKDKARLSELNRLLEHQDFAGAVRDPLYSLFVKAMTREGEFRETQTVELTASQREKRKKIAERVLKRVLEKWAPKK
ncbi:MAG: AAA family ATPase [Paludibaculum sp.]